MPLDGLEGDVEPVGDLAIGLPGGGQPGDPQLAGRERLDAPAPLAPRPGAGRGQLLARADCERPGATPRREVERLGERIPRVGAPARPAQRSSDTRSASVPAPAAQGSSGGRRRTGPGARATARPPRTSPVTRSAMPSARAPPKPRTSASSASARMRALGALPEVQERQRRARARVQIADVAHLHAPRIAAEHRAARPEVGNRVGKAALRHAQAAARGGDQHRADARRPALLREQVQQRRRLVEVAGLHGDVGQDRGREREARREITLLGGRGARLGMPRPPQEALPAGA